MSSTDYVHLRVHSEYSIADGLVRIDDLVARTRALGMPAVALTDQNNVFALVKLFTAAQKLGLKPIIGVDAWVANPRAAQRRSRLTLLCQERGGYRHLCRLLTRAHLEGQREGVPLLQPEWIEAAAGGLIMLSGAREGDVGQALLGGQGALAAEIARRWARAFPGRYYVELQRTGREGEEIYFERALDLAEACALPVVATNDVRFIDSEDFEAHEARVAIHDGRTLADPRRPRPYSALQFLRPPAAMRAVFADCPEALANSVHIAERCNLVVDLGHYHLPRYPMPAGQDVDERLREAARAGLEARLARQPQSAPERVARARTRLHEELIVIGNMGFSGYFLIVADFIAWAKSRAIPVGPGRGSGAGSLVAYALGITELDPMDYDLLFERFLNPERISMPDFDVDFCMDRRDEVIDYVVQRYGRDRVAQIITHGTLAAKAVVRDVGRVLGFAYGFVDQIAKLIPFELNITLEQALEVPALRQRYEQEDDVRTVIDLARKLEGLVRNAGRHAGGVVIAPDPLTEFMPLYCEQGASTPVTQLDMGDVEAIGLVKFDFLGLRTLTIIDWALRDIERGDAARAGRSFDINLLPLDDAATYELIRRAETTAVFQLESRGMKELIKRLRPDSFEDLIALVALFRPGPLQSGMVDDFIDRKHGRARVQYPHPALESILRPTYGVIVYQEQVMQIAQALGGYTLGAADLLRRAMGKKKPEEMARQRSVFLAGAAAYGVEAPVATLIFDLMEKFAGYGFNKSHSAAYALIAYQTAWLKAHHPAAFMAAVLSADMDNTDKVVGIIDECRGMRLGLLPPDVNTSEYKFTVADARRLRYGLGAIRGVGASVVEALVAERTRGGAYRDLFDLCQRLDPRRINRRVLEALARAGALDALGPNRASLLASLDRALGLAEQQARAAIAGQQDMFGLSAPAVRSGDDGLVQAAEWTDEQRLAGEKETLGLYLTGHPVDRLEAEIAALGTTRLAQLKPGRRRVIGLVTGLRTLTGRRGRVCFATLDDRTARVDVAVYSELLDRHADLLVEDRILYVEGTCALDDFSGGHSITAERLMSVEQVREHHGATVVIALDQGAGLEAAVPELAALLAPYRPGPCTVVVSYRRAEAEARLRLGADWSVRPSDTLIACLRGRFGRDRVAIEYVTAVGQGA